jgi:ubiquinone/menaquinone biosynthesis C-methylase UbiE
VDDDVAAFVNAVPAGATVAGIGCGPGRDAAALTEHGLRVFRLDISLSMLRPGDPARIVQADMRALPIRSASLDRATKQS